MFAPRLAGSHRRLLRHIGPGRRDHFYHYSDANFTKYREAIAPLSAMRSKRSCPRVTFTD
jgi:hypothetical protein